MKVQFEHTIESSDFMDDTAYHICLDPDERNFQDPTEIDSREVEEELRGISESILGFEDRRSTKKVTRANSEERGERLEALGYK